MLMNILSKALGLVHQFNVLCRCSRSLMNSNWACWNRISMFMFIALATKHARYPWQMFALECWSLQKYPDNILNICMAHIITHMAYLSLLIMLANWSRYDILQFHGTITIWRYFITILTPVFAYSHKYIFMTICGCFIPFLLYK